MRLTGDVQSQAKARDVGGERDLEAVRGQERFEDVAHDVDLVLVAALQLLPDDRVVEHVELVGAELAEHFERLAAIEHEHLAVGQHRHRVTCSGNQSNNSPVHSTTTTRLAAYCGVQVCQL